MEKIRILNTAFFLATVHYPQHLDDRGQKAPLLPFEVIIVDEAHYQSESALQVEALALFFLHRFFFLKKRPVCKFFSYSVYKSAREIFHFWVKGPTIFHQYRNKMDEFLPYTSRKHKHQNQKS